MVPLSEIDLMNVPTEKKVKKVAKKMILKLIKHEETPELMKTQLGAILPRVYQVPDDIDVIPLDHYR